MAVVAVLGLSACVTPTGDFGRAAPGEASAAFAYGPEPGFGTSARRAADRLALVLPTRPGPEFLDTDEEDAMKERVWRFITAPHARTWMFDRSVMPQRQSVALLMATDFDPADYYLYLKRQHYRSSPVRYRTVAGDIEADLGTLPATFEALCAVSRIGDRRRIAVAEIYPEDTGVGAALAQREAENAGFVTWFVRALTARENAYGLALDRLLVETPHEEARAVNEALLRLALFTDRARRREFCPPLVLPGVDPTMGFAPLNVTGQAGR